ncbi:MAG TPA: ParB N-terminal domain-containing protein [Patescibacteria group bacterium]|nr:ParB N-terminal domain-containing protein [Patescibacteria group bacterium]
MKQNVVLVDIQKLIQHERVHLARLKEVRKALRKEGVVRRPVIVDQATNIILDGHHRVQALKVLGAKCVPVAYVRYQDARVRVYMRRKDILMKLIKKYVVETVKSNDLFPSKTTRHLIHDRPTMKPMLVESLRRW